jgi:hypothetical protein
MYARITASGAIIASKMEDPAALTIPMQDNNEIEASVLSKDPAKVEEAAKPWYHFEGVAIAQGYNLVSQDVTTVTT